MLYLEHTHRLHILNATGALLWQGLAGGASFEAVTQRIARRFGQPAAGVRADSAPVVERFRLEGLLGGPARRQRRAPAARPAASQPSRPLARGERRSFRIAGRPFTVRACAPQWRALGPVLDHLRRDSTMPPAARFECAPAPGRVVVRRDGRTQARPRTAAGLQHAVLRSLVEFVFESPRWLTALHAGAVIHGGRCLVFPARGGSGKSTLVAGLAARGAAVLGDDVLALDARRLQIMAVPLALRVKQGSWEIVERLLPKRLDTTVHAIGDKRVRLLSPAPASAWDVLHRPAALIQPEFRPGAAPELVRCGAAEMLQVLFGSNSVLLGQPTPRRVGAMVSWVAALPAYRIVYGSLDDALMLLDRPLP